MNNDAYKYINRRLQQAPQCWPNIWIIGLKLVLAIDNLIYVYHEQMLLIIIVYLCFQLYFQIWELLTADKESWKRKTVSKCIRVTCTTFFVCW